MSEKKDNLEKPFAAIGEFHDVDSVMEAAEKLRDADYTVWDVHSPFPIHGISKAMGLRPTILPWIALVHGIIGLLLGLALVYFTNAKTIPGIHTSLQGYEFLVSGKPKFSFIANIPILFETTVLLSAFGTLLGMFGLNKLPMLYNPLFKSDMFRSATSDKFMIVIEADDPKFDALATPALLKELGASQVEIVND